jgi:hypothetical protein
VSGLPRQGGRTFFVYHMQELFLPGVFRGVDEKSWHLSTLSGPCGLTMTAAISMIILVVVMCCILEYYYV